MSEDIPVVPKRPTRRQTASEIPIASQEENVDQEIARARAMGKSKTEVDIIGTKQDVTLPNIPARRPIRTSTTQELNDLIDSTNEQLDEIQAIVQPNLQGQLATQVGAEEEEIKEEEVKEEGEPEEEIEAVETEESVTLEEPLVPKRPSKVRTEVKESDSNGTEETVASVEGTIVSNELEKVTTEPEIGIENESNEEEPIVPKRPKKVASDSNGATAEALEKETASVEPEEPIIPKRPSKVEDNENANDAPTTENKTEEPTIPKRPVKVNNEVNENANEETPIVPSERPVQKKKSSAPPPPVPKKPSSRIAAFQKMIEEQQMQNIQSSSRGVATNTSQENLNGQTTDPTTKTNNGTSSIGSKAQQLTGLFALPGMMPMGGIPDSLAKKLQPPSSTSEGVTASVVTSVTRRAKGPRGRKLPKAVASIEKINVDIHKNDIEIIPMWRFTFGEPADTATVTDTTPSPPPQPLEVDELNESDGPNVDNNDNGTETEIETDSIQDRDQLAPTESLEKDLEEEIETQMQHEILDSEPASHEQ
ncbi:hypothetical protein TPHA_0I02130 [Tetrapisispora phaffii CBS 4417]|uniref:Uncharacterized protein n=1 Tax=Tetrapisispora phaffii (strain ATCC 24235 / CBS 4417 / NBRC 1672 / NRRL Y-8282 / UCD 70-5) TaxID=1071381 RepID=G8BXT9_TETPH|nr:hypothetical protein TPHA_0I02130 [Tetrapisispora phaffii CBS 4417]CCE64717.1 hypothetical protein TPHA_0I02130 [Tetrapisispora phaffii CBS 4417]